MAGDNSSSDDDIPLAAVVHPRGKHKRVVLESDDSDDEVLPPVRQRARLSLSGGSARELPGSGTAARTVAETFSSHDLGAAQQLQQRETDAHSSPEADADASESDSQQREQAGDDGSAGAGDTGGASGSASGFSDGSGDDSDSDDGDQRANDALCAWCDDGGDLLLCDGSCMRAFHVVNDEGEAGCNCLRMPDDLHQRVQADIDAFTCPSCLAMQQQCFVCKRHGAADPSQPTKQQVFRCAVASCGKYYHPGCVKDQAEDMRPGAGYICPLHKCARGGCEQPPGRLGTLMELVPCRRCPIAYHQSCLPPKLSHPDANPRRVWLAPRDDKGELLPDREVDTSIIYCTKHKIPAREMAPPHLRPGDKQPYSLFPRAQLAAWRLHYARKYPILASSLPVVQAEQRRQAVEAAGGSDDDLPLAGRARHSLLSDAGREQATSAAIAKSAAPAAAQQSAQRSLMSAALSPPRRAPMSPDRRSGVSSASVQPAEAAAASKPVSPPVKLKIRLPAFRQPAQPPPATAAAEPSDSDDDQPLGHRVLARRQAASFSPRKLAAPAAPLSPPAAAQPPSEAESPLLITTPAQPAAAEPPASPALICPSAEAAAEQPSSQLAISPAAAAEPSETVAEPPGSPLSISPVADTTPPEQPDDGAVPRPTVKRQRSLPSWRPRLHPKSPVAEHAAAADAAEALAMADVADVAEAAAATAAAAAPPGAAVTAEAEVLPEAPEHAVAPEAEDEAEAEAEAAAADAVAAPVDPEEAAALQLWAEDSDADEQSEENDEQVTLRVQQLITEAAAHVSYDQLEAGIRRIQGYTSVAKKTITTGALQALQDAVKAATNKPEKAEVLLSQQARKQMARSEDDFRVFLAPFLHGSRYSSFGRHFSRTQLLQAVAEILEPFLRPNDVIVDYSCGANEFVPLVKRWTARAGFKVFGRAYDIFTARDLEDFERKSWFECKHGELPAGDRMVIGLNPPFGKDSALANQFVVHAAKEFDPRVIVLIAPPNTVTPKGYRIVFENRTVTANRAFFVPGMKEDSWNKVAPPLRIMVREEAVEMAWHDEEAYLLVDRCQCLPAHSVQNPQEPAFIGDPHKAPQPLQRGSNFGFGSAFGVPGAAAHGMGVAPAPLFQPVQTADSTTVLLPVEMAGNGGGSMTGGGHPHGHPQQHMVAPDAYDFDQQQHFGHQQQQHFDQHQGPPHPQRGIYDDAMPQQHASPGPVYHDEPRYDEPRYDEQPQHFGRAAAPAGQLGDWQPPMGPQGPDWQPPPFGDERGGRGPGGPFDDRGAPGGPLGPMRRSGSFHRGGSPANGRRSPFGGGPPLRHPHRRSSSRDNSPFMPGGEPLPHQRPFREDGFPPHADGFRPQPGAFAGPDGPRGFHRDGSWDDGMGPPPNAPLRVGSGRHGDGPGPGPARGGEWCDRCGQQGHKGVHCRQPAGEGIFFCRRCGGQGHISRNCGKFPDQRGREPAAAQAPKRLPVKRPRSPAPGRCSAEPPAAKRRGSGRRGGGGASGSNRQGGGSERGGCGPGDKPGGSRNDRSSGRKDRGGGRR